MTLTAARRAFVPPIVLIFALVCAGCQTPGPPKPPLPKEAKDTHGLATGPEGHYLVEALCNGKPVTLEGDGKEPVKAAPGSYEMMGCLIERPDATGVKWAMAAVASNARLGVVNPGQTTELTFGPPLRARLNVTRGSADLVFNIAISGQAGEVYAPTIKRGGGMAPAPGVEIRDASGKVIAQASLRYG